MRSCIKTALHRLASFFSRQTVPVFKMSKGKASLCERLSNFTSDRCTGFFQESTAPFASSPRPPLCSTVVRIALLPRSTVQLVLARNTYCWTQMLTCVTFAEAILQINPANRPPAAVICEQLAEFATSRNVNLKAGINLVRAMLA